MYIPTDIENFTKLEAWWRTPVASEIILSGDGVGDLLAKLALEGKKAFFVADGALREQPRFEKIFARENIFVFDATASEPRTGDVDELRALIKGGGEEPDTIVGVGGGATMDLAKAAAICLANPEPAQYYQGYGLDMKKGADIWVLPTLSGTGAEITPIAVLRGPEKKLGINNRYAESTVAVIDPQLSAEAPAFNRFFTMMDCYFHHYEIMTSKTSSPEAIADAKEGLALSRELLSRDLSEFSVENAIISAMASLLGGSSSISGRVGAAHAISYGLSNSAPRLPHSVAVAISMSALEEIYPDGYVDTRRFLEINRLDMPRAADYGIGEKDIEKMTRTALGMEKLWQSCFGEGWQETATPEYIENIYEKIIKE
ncbi:MAG: iron-containing alcohol dehydrogenase [Synergistaceae bacterium]|nr:iron-containing alcohol dehydrogenase [Synergistaceae bacterium]